MQNVKSLASFNISRLLGPKSTRAENSRPIVLLELKQKMCSVSLHTF